MMTIRLAAIYLPTRKPTVPLAISRTLAQKVALPIRTVLHDHGLEKVILLITEAYRILANLFSHELSVFWERMKYSNSRRLSTVISLLEVTATGLKGMRQSVADNWRFIKSCFNAAPAL